MTINNNIAVKNIIIRFNDFYTLCISDAMAECLADQIMEALDETNQGCELCG